LQVVFAVPSPVLYAHCPTWFGEIVAVVGARVAAVVVAVVALVEGIQMMFAPEYP
jgi:hypothetical protein